jgi:tetratricopeptide (TPR) repeat protein
MTIKELHDHMYNDITRANPQLFMDQYKANLDVVNNADLTNLDDFTYAMELTCDYGIFLENSGHFKKAIAYLDEAIDMMEHFPNYQGDELFDVPNYQLVLFHKARAFYHLKFYKDSRLIFDSLRKAFPENEKYRGWISRINVKRYETGVRTGMGVMLVALVVRLVSNGRHSLTANVTYWILLVALVGTVAFEIGKRIELKKLDRMNML